MKLLSKEEEARLLELLPDEVEYLNPIWLMKTGKCDTYGNIDREDMEFACVGKNNRRLDIWIYGSPDSEELANWLRSHRGQADFIGSLALKDMMLENVEHKHSDYVDYYILEKKNYQPHNTDEIEVRLLRSDELSLFDKLDREGMSFFEEWNTVEEALKESILYVVADRKEVLSFAMLYGTTKKYMEIGVWTHKAHRRKGLSYACSCKLIQGIFSEGKTPVWGTERGNVASKNLAKKLGFQKVHEYYWVTPTEEEF